MNEIVCYPCEKAQISVRFDGETVWLTQQQMADVFECSPDNISLHLKNIFADGELDKSATAEEFSVVQIEGGRKVSRSVAHYNLDAIISVGYRVNSRRGVQFRQWATKIIKDRIRAASPSVRHIGVKARPLALPKPVRRSKSAATCSRCLFGRIVHDEERGELCECHVSRPTASGGFPAVRPDDFCPLHVSIRGRVRTFAGLVPEIPQPIPVMVRAESSPGAVA